MAIVTEKPSESGRTGLRGASEKDQVEELDVGFYALEAQKLQERVLGVRCGRQQVEHRSKRLEVGLQAVARHLLEHAAEKRQPLQRQPCHRSEPKRQRSRL